jgi:protein-tyrosine phosphatase
VATRVYWIDGPWPGRLGIAARPRGGDWLDDELNTWQSAGISTVVSLLTRDEEDSLDLKDEAASVKSHHMDFLAFPIADRQVPPSRAAFASALDKIHGRLSSGKNVVIHCRQGIGRSGLVGACLLVLKGLEPDAAVQRISTARGLAVPETPEQRRWIDQYAASLAGAK